MSELPACCSANRNSPVAARQRRPHTRRSRKLSRRHNAPPLPSDDVLQSSNTVSLIVVSPFASTKIAPPSSMPELRFMNAQHRTVTESSLEIRPG
jgi:hypothetical protein